MTHDVVIVGAGPVGLSTAIALGQRGHSVVVLERWPQAYPLPRAVHFDHEVGRLLASCGIGDDLRAHSEPAEVYEWRNADGVVLLRFGRIGLGASGWPESSMFSQPDVEAALETRAAALPTVTIRRGVDVTGVTDHGDGVEVHTADGTTHAGRYVVGCDGANSTVRAQLGVEMVDLGFFHDWLIVDVILDEARVFDPLNVQVCDPARPTTMVSGGPGRRRWEFMALPGEDRNALKDIDRAWELLAPWDVTPHNARLERHAVYTFGARYATRWRVGRVLLAGDAVHQMPPFAGQGMCAGVRDAVNLSWKLDAVLSGHAPTALLDCFQTERLPSAIAAIEFSIELGKVICVADPAEAAARDAAMSAAVTDELTEAAELPGITTGVIHPAVSGAGSLSVHGTSSGRWLDDVYPPGWRLVSLAAAADADPSGNANADPSDHLGIDPDQRDWFTALGGTFVAVTDPGAGLAEWFDRHGARHALVRPDFIVFGTAPDADDAAGLLAELRHQLTHPETTTGSTVSEPQHTTGGTP